MEIAYQLLTVALVLGLLLVSVRMLSRNRAGWWTGWRRPPNRKHEIELIDRLSLTPQHSVHLLRVRSRTLLVSCQPGGATLLATFDADSASGVKP